MSSHKSRPKLVKSVITDYYTNYEDITRMPGPHTMKETQYKSKYHPLRILNIIHPSRWIFLILLGIITAIVSYGIDTSFNIIWRLKAYVWEEMDIHWTWSFLIWIGITLFLTLIAASIGQFVSKGAEGSGIPELKSILAGVNIYRYLSFRTLIGKIIGLIAATTAGFSVGREGPFVHISAGIVNKLSKFKPFREIYLNQSLKKQMLAASVAAGITATFGAPFGGVLYSIEVTSTYYMVGNLWKAFFSSCWAMFTFKVIATVGNVELFSPTKLITLQLDYQYIAYAILGILWGVLGTFLINVIAQLLFMITKLKLPYISNRWILCLTIGLVIALTSFPIDFLRLPDHTILQEMFSQDPLETKDRVHWNQPNIIFNLSIFVIIKFIMIALWISWPVPAGIFIPTFVLGAVFGRLYGYILRLIFGSVINETAYSIIGAASVTASVTRTISVAMIIFEINGELSYLIPVLLGVLLSYAVSNSLWVSIFDVLLDMKDLPYMPAIKIHENYSLMAKNIMNKNFQYLCKNSKLSDISHLLSITQSHSSRKYKSISVLRSEDRQLLLFSVEVQSLRKYLIQYYSSISHTFEGEAKEQLDNYFNKINSISPADILDKTVKGIGELLNDSKAENVVKRQKHDVNDSPDTYKNKSNSKINELEERKHSSDLEDNSIAQVKEFWNSSIDWEHEWIQIDTAPFTVMEDTPLAKIHFLFTMLNISQLFVISEGILFGIITKNEFLRTRNIKNHGQIEEDIQRQEEPENRFDEFHFEGRELKRNMPSL